MGCSNSNQAKDQLISPNPDNNKVNQMLSNGTNGSEKLKNSVNEAITDVNNLEFKKAQEDLQKIGEGLKDAVGEGVEGLMKKVLPTSNGSMTSPPPEEEVKENTNTPVPTSPVPDNDEVGSSEPKPPGEEGEAGEEESEMKPSESEDPVPEAAKAETEENIFEPEKTE